MSIEPQLRVANVSKRFDTIEVLTSISFDVPARGFTCIVGPSGCGKTTLLKIVLGLEGASGGEVTISPRVAGATAYIPQKSLLLPWRTALQNVCLGLELQSEPKLGRGSVDYVSALMGTYGLRGFENAYPRQLSGGMEQRVAILRAFARRAKLLVCDEPFAAVDYVTRLKLNSEFRDLCVSSGTTVVFVTHNIEEALFFAHKLLVLSGRPGRIIKTYSPDFSLRRHDPIEIRRDPAFGELSAEILKDLEVAHAG